MPIQFPCPQCGSTLSVPDQAAGKQARCPQCQAIAQVRPRIGPPPDLATESPAVISAGAPVWNPAPSSNNPFADVAGAAGHTSAPPNFGPTGELNPYASPALDLAPPGPRRSSRWPDGLPWENGPSPASYFETLKALVTQPSDACRALRPEASVGYALGFCAISVTLIFGLLGALFAAIMAIAPENANNPDAVWELLALALLWLSGGLATIVVVPAIYALAFHLILLAAGGAKKDYGVTYRSVAYTYGATMISYVGLSLVPCAGGILALVHSLWVLSEGLAGVHNTTGGRAWLAVLVGYASLFGLLIGAGFALGAAF